MIQMMNLKNFNYMNKKISLFIFTFFISITLLHGQDNHFTKNMISKIDSIAKVNKIKKAVVKILYITNTFDHTDTNVKSLTRINNFVFDGPFLVIENKYFNINKLLYFKIDNNYLSFYFQAY